MLALLHTHLYSTPPSFHPTILPHRAGRPSSRQFISLVLLTHAVPRLVWRLTRVSLCCLAGSAPLPWVSDPMSDRIGTYYWRCSGRKSNNTPRYGREDRMTWIQIRGYWLRRKRGGLASAAANAKLQEISGAVCGRTRALKDGRANPTRRAHRSLRDGGFFAKL